MSFTIPVSIAMDFSEHALETAWKECHEPETYSLTVGTRIVRYARDISIKQAKRNMLFVNPEWTEEWMFHGKYMNVFSEAA